VVDRRIEQSMSVAETRMLKWTSGVKRENGIRNDTIDIDRCGRSRQVKV